MKKLPINNSKTFLMGILNITSDSFSDGGQFIDKEKAVHRATEMIREGADIIDIGGESARPGSEQIPVDEELKRVIPVIKTIRKIDKNIFLSVDTYKSEVAEQSIKNGVNMVNSLGGFTFDKKLADIVANLRCPVILYHIKGKPKTMQEGDMKYNDVIDDIKLFFRNQINFGLSKNIKRKQFIIDPGIGFGKTLNQNIEIIKRLKEFTDLHLPIAIGVSRKSHLGQLLRQELNLQETPNVHQRLEASLAETAVAVFNNAQIVRTHDIRETKKYLTVLDYIKHLPLP